MIFKKIIYSIAVLALGVLASCTDKKKEDQNVVKNETEQKVTSDIDTQTTEISEAEKRKLDSIRQVKEHGHAH
ncbi:hypothetical protein [Aquimarina muelleri]|uniref:Lipoprotein n=1 Tax=Aquimarina muelleri TaxID=279356 RepID=A0A918JTV9_9FLAO|nr:hypothetical protein [Aquimarina muelleri]MCX2761169.1 hypothetical protein [Aquimarina muelleri]GGX08798.1 hypothetical protein GCM10007384_08210 [Aquimarina muelleri]